MRSEAVKWGRGFLLGATSIGDVRRFLEELYDFRDALYSYPGLGGLSWLASGKSVFSPQGETSLFL